MIYLLIARYNDTDHAKVLWTVGVINIAASLSVAWIRPIPRAQINAKAIVRELVGIEFQPIWAHGHEVYDEDWSLVA